MKAAISKFFLCMAVCCPPALAEVPHLLRACGDVNEFAPFLYFVREGGHKTSTVAGLDIDVLHKVLGDAGHAVEVEMLPWARCLVKGARGEVDLLLDGINTAERRRDFELSQSHYAMVPVFVYLANRPKPDFQSRAALARLRVCSQADYNYAPYGVPNEMSRNRARTLDDAVTMLRLGRCNVMLQQGEVMQANSAMGGVDILGSAEFGHETPAWVSPVQFYFLVGRTLPYRRELIDLLDQGITRLKKSGELERMHNAQTGAGTR